MNLMIAKIKISNLTEFAKIFQLKNSEDKERVKFLLLLSLQVHRDFHILSHRNCKKSFVSLQVFWLKNDRAISDHSFSESKQTNSRVIG